jgi:hypothetical protein
MFLRVAKGNLSHAHPLASGGLLTICRVPWLVEVLICAFRFTQDSPCVGSSVHMSSFYKVWIKGSTNFNVTSSEVILLVPAYLHRVTFWATRGLDFNFGGGDNSTHNISRQFSKSLGCDCALQFSKKDIKYAWCFSNLTGEYIYLTVENQEDLCQDCAPWGMLIRALFTHHEYGQLGLTNQVQEVFPSSQSRIHVHHSQLAPCCPWLACSEGG